MAYTIKRAVFILFICFFHTRDAQKLFNFYKILWFVRSNDTYLYYKS